MPKKSRRDTIPETERLVTINATVKRWLVRWLSEEAKKEGVSRTALAGSYITKYAEKEGAVPKLSKEEIRRIQAQRDRLDALLAAQLDLDDS